MSLPTVATNIDLNNLIFYSIDKASPYALANFPTTNSLDKISDMTLVQLAISSNSLAIMWLWINAHSAQFGASPVPPDSASKVKTVGDVITAVYNTLK